jgi:NAD(P)-dependent dehydrogenase (short-subunit alcohol dehydrogenase family)
MTKRTAFWTGLTAAAACVAYNKWRRGKPLELLNKVVLITGGSRGLGLAMARAFGARRAIVVICARDWEELQRARVDLEAREIKCHTFVCDITRRNDVMAMVSDITDRIGFIDILVNNAGRIKAGPFTEMSLDDFDQAMNAMFWGTLHTIHAVLPGMRLRRRGNIVNITSIGGKVSLPHMLPYSCAKFAATALSEGLRPELAPHGIRVTTIAPGLIRTGSHVNAEFKGDHDREYAWFAAGSATPLLSISAETAANAIVKATVRGDSERILGVPAEALAKLHALFPGLVSDGMLLANKFLPKPESDGSDTRVGSEMEENFVSYMWKKMTASGREAAESLNETPPHPANGAESF